jgi:hypothetical protein
VAGRAGLKHLLAMLDVGGGRWNSERNAGGDRRTQGGAEQMSSSHVESVPS